MRAAGLVSVLALVALTAPVLCSEKKTQAPSAKGLDGLWLGTLKAGPVELRLLFHIKKDGKTGGTMDSLDQGAKGLPIDTVELKDDAVKLDLKKIGAAFEGKLTKDGSQIKGQWQQSGAKFPLTLRRVAKPPELARPQHPKRPYPYVEHDVVVENAKADVRLAGTLTVPRAGGPFPAVVLLSGSGPQDRDETLFGHKPFLVLADYLTRRGIAVLRLDDRGVGGSTGDTFKATIDDEVEDAVAAVSFLKGRKEIDGGKVGLVGHSEGGIVAPLAASRSKDVAFIVLLAGTGLPGEEILYLQGQALLKGMGASDKQLKRQRALQELIFQALKEEKDDAKARKLIFQRLEVEKAKLSAAEKKEMTAIVGLIEAQMKAVLTPWFRFLLSYDPRPALTKVQVPVLALIGEKDLQVPAKENLAAIGKALRAGGNKDYTLKKMPRLNHLLQTCKTGAITEYGQIEETMAPAALELIGDWILRKTVGR